MLEDDELPLRSHSNATVAGETKNTENVAEITQLKMFKYDETQYNY